ncbi:acyl-CoA dehydrogenase family protein [Chloroflexota bacterium]
MDFELSEGQKMIRDMCREFTNEVIAPRAEEMERTGNLPYDIISQMADLGMMGIPFAEKYGGGGGDWIEMSLCIEEVSRGDIGLGVMLDVAALIADEIGLFGTEEQKQKWLTPLVQGKKIGAFALTEPDAGSHAASIKCTAVLDDDEWIINGNKQFISNIGLDNCSLVIVAAVSGKDKQGKNIINTIIVPKNTPGLTVGPKENKISTHSLITSGLTFEDCRVPKNHLLGEEGKGLAQHLAVLQTGRICIAACSVGLAQACLNSSLSYAQERIQFDKPIISFQGVSFKLADMATAIELGRLMYLKAAWLKQNNMPYAVEAAIAKLYASEAVEAIASNAVQIHGGYGYMSEYAVSRYYKQAKAMQITEGTSEIQRMIIAKSLQN